MYLKFYRPNMRSINSVTGNYIYASAPIKFNDPFEAMCINEECSFAKIRYISSGSILVSSCTFYMDASVPNKLLGEILKDIHESMSLFLRKMS